MHALPGAIVPPAPKVLIDNLPRGEVMRQQAPGTATAQDIEDRIQDLTFRIFLGPPTGLGGRHQIVDQVPFFVAQVGRVRFAGFHAPMLPEVADPGQSFKHAFRAGCVERRLSVLDGGSSAKGCISTSIKEVQRKPDVSIRCQRSFLERGRRRQTFFEKAAGAQAGENPAQGVRATEREALLFG
jgi:hypothetical protein